MTDLTDKNAEATDVREGLLHLAASRRFGRTLIVGLVASSLACGGTVTEGGTDFDQGVDPNNGSQALPQNASDDPNVSPVFLTEIIMAAGTFIIGGLVKSFFGDKREQQPIPPPAQAQPKPDGYGCTDHFECASGFCDAGICGLPQPPTCDSDADCNGGEFCGPIDQLCYVTPNCPAGTVWDATAPACVQLITQPANTNIDDGNFRNDVSQNVPLSSDNAPCLNNSECASGFCLPDATDQRQNPVHICGRAQAITFSNGDGSCNTSPEQADPRLFLIVVICATLLTRRRRAA